VFDVMVILPLTQVGPMSDICDSVLSVSVLWAAETRIRIHKQLIPYCIKF